MMRKKLAFPLWIALAMAPSAGFGAETSVRLYERLVESHAGPFRADQSAVATIRIPDSVSANVGVRMGEGGDDTRYFQYVAELGSPRYLEYLKTTARLSNESDFSPESARQSYWLLMEDATFPVGERWKLGADAGVFRRADSKDTASLAPAFSGGANHVDPLYRVKAEFELTPSWELGASCGNFDVFSAYLANTPFLQGEVDFKIHGYDIFAYERYRWQDHIQSYYRSYTAIGVKFRI
jgi:hypothetical protein